MCHFEGGVLAGDHQHGLPQLLDEPGVVRAVAMSERVRRFEQRPG